MRVHKRLFLLLVIHALLISIAFGQGRMISGSVVNQNTGKGIPGIVVTDGFSVIKTNAKGTYSFFGHPDAEFVYLSLPAGYKIPTDQFLPKFYHRIAKGKSKYNFKLEKDMADDSRHLLIVGADPQPASEEASQKWLQFAQDYFKPVLKEFPSLPKVGILCGDLVGDDLSLFANHKKAIASMEIPCFQVLGNHDENYEVRTDELSQKVYRESFGPEYYSFNKGKIHYIVLDDVFYLGKNYSYIGYLNERQFKWLENDLRFVPKGSTIIVALHIPLEYDLRKPVGSETESLPGDNDLVNASHFYKLLDSYNVHIMSGHTHWNQSFEKNNIFHHIHGAICGAWWDGQTSFDGTPLGYGVYEIDHDNVSWYYQSAGKDRSHQMQLTYIDSATKVVANVWNWDDKWKVELFADGRNMGAMTRYIGYSPVMSEYYSSLPPDRPWMKPVLTAHLFQMNVDQNVRSVTVKVTDRFGKIYSDSLTIRQ